MLVAEDEATFGLTVARALKNLNHEVKVCPTGKATLKALDSTEWDVLLLDLKLPDADGVDILTRVRKEHPELQTIIVTGFANVQSAIETMRLGRLRLPDQAPELRGAGDAGGEGGREDPARAGEPAPALPGAAQPLLQHPDEVAGPQEGAAHHRDGGGRAHAGA